MLRILLFSQAVSARPAAASSVSQGLRAVSGHYPSLLLGLFFLSFSVTPRGKLGNHRRLEGRRLQRVQLGGEISPRNLFSAFCASPNLKPLLVFRVVKRRVPNIVFISFSINSFLSHTLLFLNFPSVLP